MMTADAGAAGGCVEFEDCVMLFALTFSVFYSDVRSPLSMSLVISHCFALFARAHPTTHPNNNTTKQANKAGVDEGLMLDPQGFVATCNSVNFFIVREGEVRDGNPRGGVGQVGLCCVNELPLTTPNLLCGLVITTYNCLNNNVIIEPC